MLEQVPNDFTKIFLLDMRRTIRQTTWWIWCTPLARLKSLRVLLVLAEMEASNLKNITENWKCSSSIPLFCSSNEMTVDENEFFHDRFFREDARF